MTVSPQDLLELHERLAALVSEGAGPAHVLEEVTGCCGGWALLFDPQGDLIAAGGRVPADPVVVWTDIASDPAANTSEDPDSTHGSWMVTNITAGKRPEGVLVQGKKDPFDSSDRTAFYLAATVLSLLLGSRRAVIDTERRLAGDILSDALRGALQGAELDRKMELLGFQPAAPVTVFALDLPVLTDAGRLEDIAGAIDAVLSPRGASARITAIEGRIAVVAMCDDPLVLAQALLDDIETVATEGSEARLRIGVGEAVVPCRLRHGYLSAVFALKGAKSTTRIASSADLGAYSFILGAQSPEMIEGYVKSVLGPLLDRDRGRSSDLLDSVRAFVASGGRWEAGAEALGVHRHTLRYRIRQAEELLGRDLASPDDQMDVWLALKAMELLEE